jgi:hypothetical protein
VTLRTLIIQSTLYTALVLAVGWTGTVVAVLLILRGLAHWRRDRLRSSS